MKTRNNKMKPGVLALAVQGALFAMVALPAHAEDDEVAALKMPTNFVEIGAANISKSSAKFGEYTGENKSGGYLIGNFSVRGGDAYGESNGIRRWSFTGTDLGLTSRTLSATVSDQGKWSLGFGYDELRHNLSDTYRTYLQGSKGGNAFTVPATFGTFNGNSTVVSGYTAATGASRNLNATQLALFHNENVDTTRKNASFAAGINLSPELSLQFDFNRLKQSGAKLFSSGAFGGVNGPLGGVWRAEAVGIYMNPTEYTTNNFNLALNWVGDQAHLTGGYYGSIFSNAYDRVTWENVQMNSAVGLCASGGTCTYQSTTMSVAPDNKFQQLTLSGGYAFSSDTKVSGGINYGRNTQNSNFLTGLPEIVASPQSSLNGLVVTKHADLKLTHQANRELALSVGFKHNERDNRSTSSVYQYWALNGPVVSATNNVDAATNAPYSNKKTELELAGEYRLDKSQSLRLAYNIEKNSRWCNNMANGFNNCVVSPSSKEDKLGIKYKLKATNDVTFNAGYTYAKRKADFDHNAVTPLSGLNTLTPTDVNAQDYPGFVAYIYGSRKQQMLKAGVTWQATEQLALGINGRYVSDKYNESTLGVQDSRTKGINLDSTYNYGDNNSVSAYVSWQDSKRNLKSGYSAVATDNTAHSYALLVAPVNIWTNQLADNSNSVGINTKHGGLMRGKLELVGGLSYSVDKTGYATQLGFTPVAATPCSATNLQGCGALPDIKSTQITLRLTGAYKVDQTSQVVLGYVFQKRKTEDYYYNALQYGYTPSRNMPTYELAPNYSVNKIAATYIYSFR